MIFIFHYVYNKPFLLPSGADYNIHNVYVKDKKEICTNMIKLIIASTLDYMWFLSEQSKWRLLLSRYLKETKTNTEEVIIFKSQQSKDIDFLDKCDIPS